MARDHVVRQGECIMSIADRFGVSVDKIWNAPANAELKQKRTNPAALLPGDVVHVPDRTPRSEDCPAGQKHAFRRRGAWGRLALRLTTTPPEDDDAADESDAEPWVYSETAVAASTEPRANAPYALYVDRRLVAEGTTDGDGKLVEKIAPGARSGLLVLYPGEGRETALELNLRTMDPETETSGICKRLYNLGYDCPANAEEGSPELAAALVAFQRAEGLDATGEVDGATRDRLTEVHGG